MNYSKLVIKSTIFLFLKISKYIWDPARGGVLEGGGPGGDLPPPARLLCPSIRLYLGPSTRGRVQGNPPRHGCCVQAPDYIWDPARGGVLEGGGPGGGLPPPGTAAVSKHQTISGTQHEGARSRNPPPARLLCPSIRLYLGPSTRGRARGGGSGGGVTPPGTAAVLNSH